MDAVILFSHGSLLCGAGEALKAHAVRLRALGIAPIVEVGYLNYSVPPFDETVASVVAQGATRILVAPYFLVPGKFVRVDLPRAVNAAQQAHPGVTFVVAEAIGFDMRLADALLDSAHHAFGQERWREDLSRARKFCRANPECPLFDSVNCPRRSDVEEKQRSREDQKIEVRQGEENRSSSLLVMVHGSPRPIANEDMFRVVEEVKARGVFADVQVGFMECNAPSIPEAIAACVAQGASRIVAVPYFLHTGTHVADDLPTLLEEGQAQYPHVEFAMGTYLGNSERLTDILADRIAASAGL